MYVILILKDIFITYWFAHIIISLGISGIIYYFSKQNVAIWFGFVFYLGREFTQWEYLGTFDWPGLIGPLAVCTLFHLINNKKKKI
jgi:hypothetical protein